MNDKKSNEKPITIIPDSTPVPDATKPERFDKSDQVRNEKPITIPKPKKGKD